MTASNVNASDDEPDHGLLLHVLSDDETSPLPVEGRESIKLRLVQTACLCGCIMGQGLIAVIDGITLVHVSLLYGTTPGKVSWNMMLQGIFRLLGTFLCRLLVGRASVEVISSVCIITASFFTSIAPFTPNLVTFIVTGACRGLVMGCFVLISQTFVIKAWSGHAYRNPLTQTQQAVWSIAAALSPFIIRPFLVELRQPRNDQVQDGFSKSNATFNGSMQHRFVSDANINLMFHLGLQNMTAYYEASAAWTDSFNATWISNSTDVTIATPAVSELSPEGLLSVRHAYMVIGILSALTSLPTIGLLIYKNINACGKHTTDQSAGQSSETTAVNNTTNDVSGRLSVATTHSSREESIGHVMNTYLAVATGLSFFVGGSEIIGKSLLTPFTIHHLSWSVADATLLTSTFFAIFTCGRLFGILLSATLRPMVMFAIDMLLVLAGFSLLLLLPVVSHSSNAIVWISSSLTALGLSTGFPTVLLVNVSGLEESLRIVGESKAKSNVTQATVIGTVIGSSVFVSAAGNLFDIASPMWIVYLPLICVLCIGLLIIARQSVLMLR